MAAAAVDAAVTVPFKLLIVDTIPAANKGEMAIAYGLQDGFRALGACEIAFLSATRAYDAERYGHNFTILSVQDAWPSIRTDVAGLQVRASIAVLCRHVLFALTALMVRRRALSFWKAPLWRWYLEADVVAIGHDSAYGLGGEPENPLLYPIYLPFFAWLLGKPVVFLAGTVPKLPGRFRRVARWLYRRALRQCDAIWVREAVSGIRLGEYGVAVGEDVVTADPAYLMSPAPVEAAMEIMRREGVDPRRRPVIGFTASRVRARVARPDAGSPVRSYEHHIQDLVDTIDQLCMELDADILLIPHCTGPTANGDDRVVGAAIAGRCRSKDRVTVMTGEYGPRELKALIAQVDVLVGERLHSVIAAASTGTACLALSYVGDARLQMLQPVLGDEFILHLEETSPKALASAIVSVYARRGEIRSVLLQRSAVMAERARRAVRGVWALRQCETRE